MKELDAAVDPGPAEAGPHALTGVGSAFRRTSGWLFVAAALVALIVSAPSFWRDLTRVLPAQLPFLVGEPLPDATTPPSWVTAAEGGHWTKRGWHLAPGEHGWLRAPLPGSGPGILKLRLWAHNPGTLDASIATVVGPGFSLAGPRFRGQIVDVPVNRPVVLEVKASNTSSVDHLVLERLTSVFVPASQQSPSLWPIALAATLLLAGCTTIIASRYSPRTAAWTAAVAVAVATGFALRWQLFDLARGLPLDPDAGEFMNYARDLVWFSEDRGVFSASLAAREPLHVAGLSLWLAFAGPAPASARLMTLFMSTLLVAVVSVFVWRATGHQSLAALAAWVAALNPVLIEESMRGLRTETEMVLLLATVLCWFQGRGWLGAVLLGSTLGALGLLRAPSLTVVLPLAWAVKGVRPLFFLFRKKGSDPFFKPDHWTARQLTVSSLIALSMSAPLIDNLRHAPGSSTRDRPYTTRQARIWANQEFPEKLGTPGFPTREEFQRDPYAGPELSLRDYFLGLHSVQGLVRGQIKGWVESTGYMAASLTPGLRDLVVLNNASGFRAVWRSAGVGTISLLSASLVLTALGWIVLLGDRRLWWVPVLSLWATWYVAYAYAVRIAEPFRHTAHVYPFLVLSLVWGGKAGAELVLRRRDGEPIMIASEHALRVERPALTDLAPARPIRVLFLIGSLDVGGTEQQLLEIVQRVDRRRFEPSICCLTHGGTMLDRFRAAGLHVEVVEFRAARRHRGVMAILDVPALTRAFVDLLRVIRSNRPDILHGLLFHAYMAGALVGCLARVPIVVASRRSLVQSKFDRWHWRMADRIVNRVTDAIVANSEAVRQAVANHEHVPLERIPVIYNGIDVTMFPEPTSSPALRVPSPRGAESWGEGPLRSELRLADRGPVVGVIANFIHYKGHDVFFDAWARVIERSPRAVVLLLGEGPMRERFERMAGERGFADSVRFCGTRPDVPALLSLMDVVVHPSLQEGFSNAILEAMAASRPVIAAAVGGNPEAVLDRETGILVPPGDSAALADAIRWLLDHPREAEAMGRAGRRRAAEQFQVDRMVERYEALYMDLVRKKAIESVRMNQ